MVALNESLTPLGHLAVSVLLARAGGYAGRAFRLCLAGALLPDLVDKPLIALGAVPVAHTVGHSVLVVGAAAVALALPRLRSAVAVFLRGVTPRAASRTDPGD